MATRWTLTFDAQDPRSLASFWADALGYVLEPGFDEPGAASIVDPGGQAPAISFLAVPEGKSAKNRLHIDVRGTPGADEAGRERGVRARAAELAARGAVLVREQSYGGAFGHVVMLDPEGNEFCVA
ncbi:VOC family protein [Motilibacter deserti]|uniref:VOC family protein n=1 Tax=Motilibacter deserti TaxID=2714956 RepID=A0ABX0H113_9ACTN|nr:VOC family protein [Motilibacter deserti]NHC15515.1 VOC family protein [Motilibacter deserti]